MIRPLMVYPELLLPPDFIINVAPCHVKGWKRCLKRYPYSKAHYMRDLLAWYGDIKGMLLRTSRRHRHRKFLFG